MSSFLSISDAFELYRKDYIVYKNQSKKTEEMHLCALKSLLNFTGDINLCSLTFQHVRDWKEDLDRTRSINTVRGYIIKLRVVVAYAKKRGYEVLDPDVIGVPQRKAVTIDFITPEEVDLLIQAAFEPRTGYATLSRYKNRAIISLLYASGVRVTEVVSIDILDIRDDDTFTVMGKGGKARLCFIDSRTRYFLTEYLKRRDDNHRALFISEKTGGGRISQSTVQEIFRVARKRSGIQKPVHPHTMRHSYATNLLRNNTNLLYVSKFLGHASVQTTEMYTHVVDEDLKKIYKEKHTF